MTTACATIIADIWAAYGELATIEIAISYMVHEMDVTSLDIDAMVTRCTRTVKSWERAVQVCFVDVSKTKQSENQLVKSDSPTKSAKRKIQPATPDLPPKKTRNSSDVVDLTAEGIDSSDLPPRPVNPRPGIVYHLPFHPHRLVETPAAAREAPSECSTPVPPRPQPPTWSFPLRPPPNVVSQTQERTHHHPMM